MRRLLAVCTALTCAAAVTHAAVVIPADLSELTSEARAIVHGRVVATDAHWVDGRRSIETLVTVQVDDTLKGQARREITFRVPGGQMGPYRSFMVGAPLFEPGDEIVVFLGAQGPAIPHVLGFNQGVYRVSADAVGSRRVISGAALASGHAAERQVRGAPGREPQTLDRFLEQVRTLVRDGAAR